MNKLFGTSIANASYRAESFVFGGGHVVWPLLQVAVVPNHWVKDEIFWPAYRGTNGKGVFNENKIEVI